jgi:hypothetical protein
MSIKISKVDKASQRVVKVRTLPANQAKKALKWWKAATKEERGAQAIATAAYIRDSQISRNRQAALFARMYSNAPLMGAYGSQLKRPSMATTTADRPTFNLIQSCVDTLVSRITQSRPRPVFLTDGSDYKQRNLAKQLNQFLNGELYQTKAHDLGRIVLRDAEVLGTGCIKVLERNNRVALERVLLTELLVDNNDALYGTPRTLYQIALIDRDVLEEEFPKERGKVLTAEEASPNDGGAGDSSSSADQVLVVEAWHLPSGPDAKDGRHTISCSSGVLHDEEYTKPSFPFVFMHFSPRMTGFWGQGLAEQLFGTQVEINKLLITISRAINLVGVPRVLVENSSKIVKAHVNDQIGAILTYRGVKPEFINAMSNHPELYQQLQRLIDYGFQQSGVSQMSSSSQKPAGLNSGKAIREFENIQSDRFATLSEDYDNMFIELGYKIIDQARDIAMRDGKYLTVYPNKDGTKEIDLPAADQLEDSFVIQCFSSSSLPRDPAGRLATITEYIQAGFIDLKEGRRLLDFPDIQQNERLENASEERIFKALDKIVDDGEYTAPDPFMDLALAAKLSNQYYNLYATAKLEEERAQMLRTFNSQAISLQQAAAPAPGMAPQGQLATAEPLPTSPLIPQG